MKAQENILIKAKKRGLSDFSINLLNQQYSAVAYPILYRFLCRCENDKNVCESQVSNYVNKVLSFTENWFAHTKKQFLEDYLSAGPQEFKKMEYLIDSGAQIFFYNGVITFHNLAEDVESYPEFVRIIDDLMVIKNNQKFYNHAGYAARLVKQSYSIAGYDAVKPFLPWIDDNLNNIGFSSEVLFFIFDDYCQLVNICLKNSITYDELKASGFSKSALVKYMKKSYRVFLPVFPEYELFFKPAVTYNPNSDIPKMYFAQKDIQNINKLKEMKINITAEIPCRTVSWIFNSTGNLFFTFKKYSKTVINIDKNCLRGDNICKEIKIMLTPAGKAFEIINFKKKDSRMVPLRLKSLATYYEPEDEAFCDFIECLEKWACTFGNKLIPDIISYIKNKRLWLPPVTFNEAIECQSFGQLFKKKYPTVKNWNKNDVNILYATSKVANYVTEKSVHKVLEYSDLDKFYALFTDSSISFQNNRYNRTKNGIFKFLTNWFVNIFEKQPDLVKKVETDFNQVVFSSDGWKFINETINDYVNMCLKSHEKVNLCITSFTKLIEAHNAVSNKQYLKCTDKVHVPNNSAFSKLRKLLPKEFEWIKSRKRLINETIIQHHCVWSYADKITKDECAIYSFIYEPEDKRYTIEFRYKNSNYYINQMQCCCDRGYSKEAYEYVQNFLVKQI